jgi:uncharacterized protein (DUF433 family)
MTAPARLYTPAEAAAVSGLAVKAVHNVIDKHIVTAKRIAKPAAGLPAYARRFLTADDLLHLRLESGLAGRLSVERRQSLFRQLAANPGARTLKADDLLIVDVGAARRQVADRVRDLGLAEALIARDPEVMGGEPVFRGTRVPVHGVMAMLATGATEAEVLEAYPRLDARKLALGRLWAAAHPRRGRPKSLAELGLVLKSTTRRPLKGDPLVARTPV